MSDRTLLLGIDTSSEGDLALAQFDAGNNLRLLASEHFSGRDQSTQLMPKLRLLLEAAQATLADIHAIVIVSGPGTFTGLRIGLSAAKALSQGMNIPLIAISSLAVLASSAPDERTAVLKAGRNEYYLRASIADGTVPVESLETESTLLAAIGNKLIIIADPQLASRFPASPSITIGRTGAYQAILAALPRYLAGNFEDTATLDANYVRRPYTEITAQTMPDL